MNDYSKLKELAEGCRDEVIRSDGWAGMIGDAGLLHRDEQFLKECSPEVVLALISESETRRVLIKEMDLMFGRYILAMRSALIEEEHGRGPVAAMEWIYNSLVGPGQLPPEGETDAQAYFDREIVAVNTGMEEVLKFHEAQRAAKKVTP
ncbi:hypothetical protein CFN16_12160 [Pseudomonas fluorescens]|uniref:Uncharacterized protein n=1 Tax=Pseudomonas fluorescens TaxID=294 RepID=A0A345UWJ1_PSEFL|nr:hypothetical protein [Pseudomonas fluorescens]AXJ04843.1 hypothetical protein CFN16_12160 [Pseudomonas fluorescens]